MVLPDTPYSKQRYHIHSREAENGQLAAVMSYIRLFKSLQRATPRRLIFFGYCVFFSNYTAALEAKTEHQTQL